MLELSKGLQLATRYTLARRLGGDSEAQTWLATDKLTKTSVALKIVPATSVKQLRSEWQASIRMLHAHIVRVFEFHVDDEVAFYSQQFIEGADIGTLTGAPANEVLAPVGLLADALRYIHAKGVVHRDLKASNVLLDVNGSPYLSDFGVAVRVGEFGEGGSPIAQTPQSIAGASVTPADDIFALGTLIYELLTGAPPWSPASLDDDIAKKPAPLMRSATGEELPTALQSLVARMLEKDAELRPTAEDVAAGLVSAGYAAGAAAVRFAARPSVNEKMVESVESVRPSANVAAETMPIERVASGINRNAMLVALVVLLAVLVGVVFVLPNRVEQSPDPIVVDRPLATEAETDKDPVVRRQQKTRTDVYVDPAIRQRMRRDAGLPVRKLEGDDDITFSENSADYSGLDDEGRARFNAEMTLGELLSALEVLEGRGIDRWAPLEYRKARDLYTEGDKAYLEKQFLDAEELYLGALTVLEPTYKLIEPSFDNAYAAALAAFDAGDRLEAIKQFELAVAVTPTHAGALAGLERARNMEAVLSLVAQGNDYEEDLDLVAAQRSFESALALDSLWQPAEEGLQRVKSARTKLDFDLRMSEGFAALASGDYLGARAAFRVAQKLLPNSAEPADGLLQVSQGMQLSGISVLEQEVHSLENDEHWDAVISTYEEILNIDNTLSFASDGLQQAREMSALHTQLDVYIEEPDKLSAPATMQNATKLLVSITTRPDVGPRLAAQRDELSRLLKRASTPLKVALVSDNQTEVVVYKVGRMGSFMRQELSLRPGTYVAVGSRAGYRDVRLEFRVAPEVEMQPVIVQCEEQI